MCINFDCTISFFDCTNLISLIAPTSIALICLFDCTNLSLIAQTLTALTWIALHTFNTKQSAVIVYSGVATGGGGGARGRAPPQPHPGPPMRFMQI